MAQFMVANATGATAVIEDETFGGEVRVTLEDAFLSAAGETCKRATLLSAQHEAEIVVICHNGQEGDGSTPANGGSCPACGARAFPRRSLSAHPSTPSGAPGGAFPVVLFLDAVRPSF
ncbi:MAG: DVU3141 family protein [Bilophila wadsworthia]